MAIWHMAVVVIDVVAVSNYGDNEITQNTRAHNAFHTKQTTNM